MTSARKLSRVVEGLEPVLHERPDGADVRHEFSALYDALQTIVSVMIGYADTAAGGEAASGRELVSALEGALAKARRVRDSVLAQEGAAHGQYLSEIAGPKTARFWYGSRVAVRCTAEQCSFLDRLPGGRREAAVVIRQPW